MKKNFDQYFNTEKIKKKRDVFKENLNYSDKIIYNTVFI